MNRLLSFLAVMLLFCGSIAGQAKDDVPASFAPALRELEARVSEDLTGRFVITLKISAAGNLKDDSDLGPFIRSAIKHDEDELALLAPLSAKQMYYVVFFRKSVAVAFSRQAGDAKDRLSEIETNRAKIQEPAPARKTKWFVQPVELKADDGTGVAALRLEKLPNDKD